MTDLHARVPEWIEHALSQGGDALIPGIVGEKQHVDVAVGRDQSPPIAADSDQRDSPEIRRTQLHGTRCTAQTAE